MPISLANALTGVTPHPAKSLLSTHGITQAHVARLLNRGDLYVWRRINGFKSFSSAEESAIADVIARASSMQEAGNA